jgi:hypothetical protein
MKRSPIKALIEKLDGGGDVSRRRLYRAIGATALAKMEREWREEVRSRSYRPPEIAEYAKRLGIALRKYGKADLHSIRGSVKAGRLFEVAESDFENALEYLNEVVQRQPDLRMWIDREVGFDKAHIELHPIEMPYPIWSKSPYARKGGLPKRTIRDFKREALEEALERLEKRARRKSEPLPELPMIVRSKSLERLQSRDFSGWTF